MNERKFFKCEVCGNIVGLIKDGGGELYCCGQPMKKLEPNTVDAAQEKHVPVHEKVGDTLTVKVGSVPHPMTDEHWIQWICVEEPDRTQRVLLNPGDAPEATFKVSGDKYDIFEYCNLHGLWTEPK